MRSREPGADGSDGWDHVPECRGKAEAHRAAGNAYLALRDDCRRFRLVHVPREGGSEEEMILRLNELAKRKADLNLASPQTPEWAYRKAQANIAAGQTSHRI